MSTTQITLNDSQSQLLATTHGPVGVRESAGNLLGYLSPAEFASDQEYVDGLKAAATDHPDVVKRLIREGLDSGEPIEINDEWWRQKEAALSAMSIEALFGSES